MIIIIFFLFVIVRYKRARSFSAVYRLFSHDFHLYLFNSIWCSMQFRFHFISSRSFCFAYEFIRRWLKFASHSRCMLYASLTNTWKHTWLRTYSYILYFVISIFDLQSNVSKWSHHLWLQYCMFLLPFTHTHTHMQYKYIVSVMAYCLPENDIYVDVCDVFSGFVQIFTVLFSTSRRPLSLFISLSPFLVCIMFNRSLHPLINNIMERWRRWMLMEMIVKWHSQHELCLSLVSSICLGVCVCVYSAYTLVRIYV